MIETILIATVVILLIVVFVPIGIALYQRTRARESEARPPAPKPAAPPPPPLELPPDGSTAKIPALTNLPPAADPPTAPAIAKTKLAVDGMTGTVAVQWFGLLLCTEGALEGQRFIIEEEGLYIGRDAALSKIVIPDGRISKRHVRIVPRSGQVWAIDQNSTNGTFIGDSKGQRITEVQLRRGDKLVLADDVATFLYQL